MKTDMYLSFLPSQYDFIDRYGAKGQRGVLRVRRNIVLPVIRSLDADDEVLGPGVYKMAMEVMDTKKRRALFFVSKWDGSAMKFGPSFAARGLAIHDFGARFEKEISGFPKGLNGCVTPGLMFRRDGVALPVSAMQHVFDELGGWKDHAEFQLQILP